jgi:hypothetical protein
MNIRLHKNARTTPSTRREIQHASGSGYELAERFGGALIAHVPVRSTLSDQAR